MAEYSMYWGGTVTGDASLAPYSDDEFSDNWRILFQQDRAVDGHIQTYLNKLVVTGAASPVTVATGSALVDGKMYVNDAPTTVVIPTPAVSTRYDRLVLRKNWVAQTVRLTRIAGVEGAGVPPAVTQIDGTTWDIPLYTVIITIAGAITLVDNRIYAASPLTDIHPVCNGRITLTSATPVTTADVTAATTIYFTPYAGNKIALYDGSNWRVYNFSELSLSIAGYTASKPFDVFVYNNAGILALTTVEWTNTTTRATALTTQDGVYVLSGTTTRRYVGTICTTSTIGQTEDSASRRLVWNYYNRVPRRLWCTDTTNTWNYTTATVREANGASTDGTSRFSLVIGVNESLVQCNNESIASNTNAAFVGVSSGVGVDSTSAMTGIKTYVQSANAQLVAMSSGYCDYPGIGYHYFTRLEYSQATGTTTWYGDSGAPTLVTTGMIGTIPA